VTTLRHGRKAASPTLDPLWAALLGLAAGVSLGGHLKPLCTLLAILAGGAPS
jgi:hypothetical protein